ncbi:MAG: SagB/ThcOx family dehydrogenase, partial [Candidatus Rokubacteria bacterium]|nr:SagB/ThcOx family dehydrogenase [Candidatus Rokubacteria bacterium]
GVTKKKTYPGGGEVLFRAAASTGALYQTEVYVAAGAVEGLAPGLYHFCPGDFTLRRLRAGDVRGALAAAAADETVARRAATIVLTAIYWRNTWKYQARGWRHLFWDSGTLLANLLAAGGTLGLAPRLLTGFADAAINRLLGVDATREAALELVTVGPETAPAPPVAAFDDIQHAYMPLSSDQVDYPLLREMHTASMLDTPDDVRAWRAGSAAWSVAGVGAGGWGRPPRPVVQGTEGSSAADEQAPRPVDSVVEGGAPSPPPRPQPEVALPPPRAVSGRGLGETIQQRGSTRQFGHTALTAEELATALWAATRGVDADVPSGLVDLYLIVNAVDGVAPGAYAYWPEAHALELLKRGEFRREAAYLCLEQPLAGDAAAVIFFLARLDALLEAFGNRGARLANLEAGIAGGRAYLAAYAQGFGASGLTFYDGLVVDFFSPHAAGKDAVFVTALGRSAGVGHATIERNLILPPGRPS